MREETRKQNTKIKENYWRINGEKEKGSGDRKKKRGRKKGKGGKICRDENINLKIEKARIKPHSSMKKLWACSDFVELK